MDFREHKIDFREAERRYAELKRQLDAKTISPEEFGTQLQRLMVQDAEGRWWAKSRKTGEWNYHDGSAWVRGSPPGYQPARQSQPEQLPPSQTALSDSAPTAGENTEKRRRGLSRWVVLAAGLVGMAALAGMGIIAAMGGVGSNRTPAYDLVEDDSGKLSVEVPTEWKEHITSEPEGEKGRNWSSFLGESAGPSIAALNDLNGWRNGTVGHQGVYIVASTRLAQTYANDELLALGPNDYSSSCQAGIRRNFDRPPYSGRIQEWNNCSGATDHTAITLAAAPKGRDCVVVLQIGGYFRTRTDEENIQHVLDTFEADCKGIDQASSQSSKGAG